MLNFFNKNELYQKLKMPLAGTVNYILDRAEKYETLKKEFDDILNEQYCEGE